MTHSVFVVYGDGVVHRRCNLSDVEVRDLIRFGTVVSVFRQYVSWIQYADVDPITHEIEWVFVKQEE